MSFQTRAASLGELNGGQGASDVTAELERCKSAKSLEKKKSFRFRRKQRDESKKLSRTSSMRSLSNILQKIVVRVSSVSVQSSRSSFSTVSGNGEQTNENSSYKKRDQDEELKTEDKPPETLSLTGLKNHGNTCFMNAIVQCLAHTDLLAEYFVLGGYKQDMKVRKGQNKKFGTRGEVTEKLAVLLKNLWSSQYSSQISSDFKAVVGKHGVQYRGYAQHDAQEFLLWLLDKVHEDLNRATKRKYKANKDSVGRTDECIASESLSNHTRCNDSIVLDLFQAQHRSSLSCSKCSQQSTTFDPFLCLSLPIPQQDTRPIYITVVFVGSSRAPLRIGISVPAYSKIVDLSKAVSEMTEIPSDRLIITELSFDGFQRSFQDHQSVSIIHGGDNIYAFEAPIQLYPEPESMGDPAPVVSSEEGGPIEESIVLLVTNCVGQGTDSKRIGPPFIIHILREVSFKKLQSTILHAMKRMLQDSVDEEVNKGSPLFSLRVMNGLAGKCRLSSEIDHPLYQNTVETALKYSTDSKVPQHIRMVVEWDQETRTRCLKADVNGRPEEHSSVREMEVEYETSHAISLSDCFSLYTKDEQLGEENAWLCPKCKKHQEGTVKRLSLWSLPEVLVVHLKRFRQIPSGRTKLHTLVDFPVTDLDMNAHLEPRHKNTAENHPSHTWPTWRKNRRNSVASHDENLYDLYAVCNHTGTMSGGHYTAYCKNPTDGEWYLYDDTRVEKIAADKLNSNAAYLLFYARHSPGSSSASESSGSSDHWTRKIPQIMPDSLQSSREELDEEESGPSDKKISSSVDALNAANKPDTQSSKESVVLTESCV